jgi:hypothetical protein
VTAAATACSQAIGTAVAVAITNVTAKGTVKGIYCMSHIRYPSHVVLIAQFPGVGKSTVLTLRYQLWSLPSTSKMKFLSTCIGDR